MKKIQAPIEARITPASAAPIPMPAAAPLEIPLDDAACAPVAGAFDKSELELEVAIAVPFDGPVTYGGTVLVIREDELLILDELNVELLVGLVAEGP